MRNIAFIRTPLQAWIFDTVLELEALNSLTVIYYTTHNSYEDQHAFASLKSRCDSAYYFYISPGLSSFIHNIKLKKKLDSLELDFFECAFIASVDIFVFRSFILKKCKKVRTFDDGSANVIPSSMYYTERKSLRYKFFCYFFSAGKKLDFIKKSELHYTLYEGCGNILDDSKLKYLSCAFNRSESSEIVENKPVLNLFIGQPFHVWHDKKQLLLLKSHFSIFNFDFYLIHPQESCPLFKGVNIFDKKGFIAEQAILQLAKDYDVHLYGCMSTVMINLKDLVNINIVLVRGALHFDTSCTLLKKLDIDYRVL